MILKENSTKCLTLSKTDLAFQEAKKKRRMQELSTVKNPLISQLSQQKQRVSEIQNQIAETDDTDRENKLFNELYEEQDQLRNIEEKVTNLKLEDLSDNELKTLAVRYKPNESFFSDFFSLSDDNPYEKELVRRIKAEKKIDKEIEEAQKEKPEEGLFDFS